ncbi:uncharacterized protein LOC133909807 [Phragmites australis]|uniref:uncharacterized protein LOC133909807 n=1 Tax=Phragmites australis TaxID=29695 RepID=UPI002D773622|nr:uncharacterized protein LOC133909807 [Phragmites australis]XP_062208349.1 uncharacterized protein LOC133909807 [Phragmites australis]
MSFVDVEHLLNEWEIQCLILVSFALQVFLFFAAGIRQRSSSRLVGVLVWLAYLSADAVAIFVLGHLAVHAGGPSHQLVFLWPPFVLLHLGGQDTITAFSMQDNELWRRHLLTFAQQVALAVYDVTKSPWPDRRLLATVMLMFLSGCIKYAERTVCLATARSSRLMDDFLGGFKDRINSIKEMQTIAREGGLGSSRYLSSRAFTKFSLNPAMDVMSTDILPNYDWSVSRDIFADLYSKISRLDRSGQEDYFRQTYRFAEERLFVCYQRLYTKALFRLSALGAFLHLVTFLSTSAATVLFYFAVSGGQARQTYGSADVVVTYVLLSGAVTLEMSSFILSMFTRQDLWSHPVLCSCIQHRRIIKFVFFLTCGNCAAMLRRWRPPRHWSVKLAQYSIIGRSAQEASSGSLVPRCIAKRVTAATKPVPVTDGLKLFIIEKLLDADAMLTDTDFTGSRGELALTKWMGSLEVRAGVTEILRESLKDVDFPTSVLLWHIATDICFFKAAAATAAHVNPADKEKKIISRQLSNYIMYLVFKCGVMRTSASQFLLLKAHDEVLHHINAGKEQRQQHGDREPEEGKRGHQQEEEAMECLLRSGLLERSSQDLAAANAAPFNSSSIEILSDVVLPRAFKVAAALDSIRGRQGDHAASPWDLIAAVWLEMLYYVGPRCGAAFHRQHLTTGGELVTHVLVLMYIVGPLGYHPDMLKKTSERGLYIPY